MSSDDDKILDEERIEIAEECKFESTQTIERDSSSIEIKKIPVCDYCGKKLGDDFSICKIQRCKRKLCSKCSIQDFRNQTICPFDLRTIHPWSRPTFKIALLVANCIDNEGVIHKITRIPKKEVKEKLIFLQEYGYVDRHNFWGYCISEIGLEAIHAWSQLFGGTSDMIQLDEEVKQFVLQHS